MKIESFCVEGPIKGLVKQHAIWAYGDGTVIPLAYLQRPKGIANDAQWLTIVASIRLQLPVDFEVGGL